MDGTTLESIELDLGGGARHSGLAAGPVDGDLVLLLHGFPETARSWQAELVTLGAAGYRAVAPDQRGYASGARPANLAAYVVDELVADVGRFADVLGRERFHLVGHDWGAFVAWYAGDRLAARVRTLSVVSTAHPLPFVAALAGDTDQLARSAYMEVLRTPGAEAVLLADDAALLRAAYGDAVDAATVAEYLQVLGAEGGAGLVGGLAWYRANDFSAPIGRIEVPTLYVWSDGDAYLGPDAAAGSAAFVDGPYRFEVLEGVSHWIPEEAPEALGAFLLEHLAGDGAVA
jgi:pimeloyl-ACP methyl ester carboxylesterase